MRIINDEDLLYKVIGNLYESNAPLVFKGALVTKLILDENLFNSIVRKTVDIDANWIDKPPTMEEMVHSITDSLGDLKNLYKVEIKRKYGQGCSAGLILVNRDTNKREITIDIDVKEVSKSKIYYYGETKFKGVLVDSIIADKISAISTNSIFRRTKDILDIYALSQCVEIKLNSILRELKESGRQLGGFYEFSKEKKKLSHSYDRLKGITGKPDFESVYMGVKKFIAPFLETEISDIQWDKNFGEWKSVSQFKEKHIDDIINDDLDMEI